MFKITIDILFIFLSFKHNTTIGFTIPPKRPLLQSNSQNTIVKIKDLAEMNEEEAWEVAVNINIPYDSQDIDEISEYSSTNILQMIEQISTTNSEELGDVLWEILKKEANESIQSELQAGPFLYQSIISQPSFIDAIINFIANEIATELMPATSICNLFHQILTSEDISYVYYDAVAASIRNKNENSILLGVLFNKGLHALVCHRVSHRLWEDGRTGLAYYIQSTISSKYSADIHPAARIGKGIYLSSGKGVVIGETSVIGNDVTILQGVTLGGTGKERGDRHPKVGNGVILYDGATVLGNIVVGDFGVVTAKSIVTKAVPPFARVSGIPAKVKSFRKQIDFEDKN